MIYASYGSNLNHDQMAMRCPKAKFVGVGTLRNYRLVFRRVADIEWHKGSEVLVGLWKITSDCLASLDVYEGYPSMYGRDFVDVDYKKGSIQALIYYMNYDGYEAPSHSYFNSIKEGYEHCALPIDKLYNALSTTKNLVLF